MKGLGFIDNRLDRLAAPRLDGTWLAARLRDPGSRFAVFDGDRPAIDVTGGKIAVKWHEPDEVASLPTTGKPVLLGRDGDGPVRFAVRLDTVHDAPASSQGTKFIDLRSLALQGTLPHGELGLLAQARSLLFWHERHQFCSNCGAATEMVEAGYRRHCDACGGDHFPRTDPVVIIVPIHNGRCLLGRGPNFAVGVYSALAGFMEPGETLEDAARREVFEETGVRLGAVDYVLSQPWPFPSSLMIGLIGEALDTSLTLDRAEIEDARWFDLDDLDAMLRDSHPRSLRTPPVMAIAHHLVLAAMARIKKV